MRGTKRDLIKRNEKSMNLKVGHLKLLHLRKKEKEVKKV